MKFSDLVGKTLTAVENRENEEIVFTDADGKRYQLYHSSDCCESVTVESIVGDLADLVGVPILVADESISDTDPDDYKEAASHDDSFTWTFYRLQTIKGSVVIRWLGESNGYYSESVDFEEVGT